MNRKTAIWTVALVGLALPYLARIPGSLVKGPGWLGQYASGEIFGIAFLEVFNLIGVGAAVGVTVLFHRRMLWLLSVLPAYGFLWVAHSSLDLGSGARNAVALAFIPIYSLPFFVPGGLLAGAIWWLGTRRGGVVR